ncbi:MAG: ferrous iron transport protein A [Candidatus Cloacimonetes bacterium]|nr:ferrous iron transport protein A [Candidatus Cloacimonadota bacterium]MCK9333305.1 ferrous iron transport protein A [Candidatus Cloacimonadota bacterium]MDD3379432.1 FeoA family protein [Candidatus Methanomethylophilaceae archaeon]
MRTLNEVKCGDKVTIARLNGDPTFRRHILDMGLTKGCEVIVRKVAPLGDPIEITVRGYELTLRKQDAESIEVL